MSPILNELGITQWTQRKVNQKNLDVKDATQPSQDQISDSRTFVIRLDQAAYTKYQAKDTCTLKFITQLSKFLADNYSDIKLCPSSDELNNLHGVTFNGKSEQLDDFYSLEQIFLYPERKKSLYKQLLELQQRK